MKNIIVLPVLKAKRFFLILAVFGICYFILFHLGVVSNTPLKSLMKFSMRGSQACSGNGVGELAIADNNSVCSRIMSHQSVHKLANSTRTRNKYRPLTENDYVKLASDCDTFIKTSKYITFPISDEELDFPIAYSIVVHYKIEMFERLLRAIYAPQNKYCVHVDSKAPKAFHSAVAAIASCFHNVFIASRIEQVTYGSWARVQADLNCMRDLVRSTTPWKYLINLCGQDFPLKTNGEIIQSLISANDQNIISSYPPSAAKKRRWGHRYRVGRKMTKTAEMKKTPRNIRIFVGNTYIAVTRAFVNYVLSSIEIQQFFKWSEDTYSPDEHVWATIHRMRGVPGSRPSNSKSRSPHAPVFNRLIKWRFLEGVGKNNDTCAGTYRHNICVYGTGDLHWILRHPHHLFANKFDSAMDNTAVRCLEEYLRQKVLNEIQKFPCSRETMTENLTSNNVEVTTE
ncbi:beta-1,3-galactosyl-O-glycosyl-glycoprotein beta-1,6-N-acetylglucosaminyltransferase 3-like [Mustelus asterias]